SVTDAVGAHDAQAASEIAHVVQSQNKTKCVDGDQIGNPADLVEAARYAALRQAGVSGCFGLKCTSRNGRPAQCYGRVWIAGRGDFAQCVVSVSEGSQGGVVGGVVPNFLSHATEGVINKGAPPAKTIDTVGAVACPVVTVRALLPQRILFLDQVAISVINVLITIAQRVHDCGTIAIRVVFVARGSAARGFQCGQSPDGIVRVAGSATSAVGDSGR